MVRFQCDGKSKKNEFFFGFSVKMSIFLQKSRCALSNWKN